MANTVLVIPLASSNSAGLLYADSNQSGLVTNASGTFINANNGLVVNSSGTFINANNGLVSNLSGVFVQSNNGLISNSSGVFVNANNGLIVNSTGVYVDFSNYSNTLQMNNNLANYQTTAGLSTNVATLTANNTSFVGSVSAANVVSNAQLQANIAAIVVGNLSGTYQLISTLAANVATLTANNTSFVGSVSAANVVSNAQLQGNLGNYSNTSYLTGNYPNTTQLTSNLVGYITTGGLATNVAKLIANNTQYVGTVPVGNVISDVQLQGNLGNYPNTTQLTNNLANYQTTIIANNGIISNSTGLFVNANNGLFTNSTGLFVVANTGISVNSSGIFSTVTGTPGGANTYIQYNNSGAFGATANLTFDVATTKLSLGNGSVNVTINSTTFSGTSLTANNSTNLGGTAAAGYQTTAGLSANVAILTANNTSYLGTVAAASYQQTGAPLSANVIKMTANDVAYLGGVAAAFYMNTSGSYVFTGTHSYGNSTVNSVINSTAHLIGAINSTAVGLSLANNLITLGNSSVNATINSTVFSGISLTANNASYVGGLIAGNVVSNAQLSGNLGNYQTTVGMTTNVASRTANNTSFVGTVTAANVVSNAQLSANLFNLPVTNGLVSNSGGLWLNANTGITVNTSGIFAAAGGSLPAVITQSTGNNIIITANATTSVPLTVKGAASATANLLQVANSGSVVFAVNSLGVAVGNGAGLTGITSTFVANSGIVSNSSGVFVNANTGLVANSSGLFVSGGTGVQLLDSIAGSFNGSLTTFNLTVSSSAVTPSNPQSLIVVLGGVQQQPGTVYTVSGSTITFTTAPPTGETCYIVMITTLSGVSGGGSNDLTITGTPSSSGYSLTVYGTYLNFFGTSSSNNYLIELDIA